MISISLIIPTRNRGDTLKFCLQSLTHISDPNLEIIVSDNFSEDHTEQVVKDANDSRITYLNTGRRLGMSQNWEFALNHSSGDWVGYLGDDDGILPDATHRLRKIIESTGVQAVRAQHCEYFWPSLGMFNAGSLIVPTDTGVQVFDGQEQLRNVLDGNKSYTELPMIYHGGFASRALIDRCRDFEGQFFLSRIPDVYSAVRLSQACGSFAYSKEPLAINGASLHSTGTSSFSVSKDPKFQKSSDIFEAEDNIPFHSSTPMQRNGKIPASLQVLIFESLNKASDAFSGFPKYSADRQLRSVFKTTRSIEEINEWATDFADLHHLETTKVPVSIRIRRSFRKLTNFLKLIFNFRWNTRTFPKLKISNVYQAARIGHTLRNSGTPRLNIMLINVRRNFRKISSQLWNKN